QPALYDLYVSKHGLCFLIGVADPPAGVDEQHGIEQSIDYTLEIARLDLSEVDNLADHDGAAQVRRDHPHPLNRGVVHETLRDVAGDGNEGDTRRRFVER